MPRAYTIAFYPAEKILDKVGQEENIEVVVKGNKVPVRINSLRLKTFKVSTQCVCCGRIGNIMGLDLPKGQNKPHFNLYCNDDKGNSMVLMTKDHIIPKSRGGKNHISNMQTMCCYCNSAKGDKSPKEYKEYLNILKKEKDLLSAC